MLQYVKTMNVLLNSKPQPAYIPPYRRTNSAKYTTIPRIASGPNKAKCDEKVIIISNKFSEQRWMDCKKFGFFGYWNGPISERPKLIDWLRKHCLNQVSISHFTDRITYLHSSNEETKKKFLQLSECLFQGYVIKFFEWIPDCKEENLDFIIPTWVTLQSVPPELMHPKILKRIGASLGETVGIEAPFELCNNVRLLVKYRVNTFVFDSIKVITNSSIYYIKCLRNDTKISKICRLDMEYYSESNTIELTTDFENAIPELRYKIPKEHDLDLLKPHMEQIETNHSLSEISHMKDKHQVPIILLDTGKEVSETEKEEPIINKMDDSQQKDEFGLVKQVKEKNRLKGKNKKRNKRKKDKQRSRFHRENSDWMKVQEIATKTLISKEMEQASSPIPNQGVDKGGFPQTTIKRNKNKFWQTSEQSLQRNEAKQNIESISRDLSHFLNRSTSDLEETESEAISNEHLERLTEDLIYVFSPGNSDTSSLTQKEDLLKRLLKLGG